VERRLKVLISAYACEPGRGSEAGVGWTWATEIAEAHDVWVLTRANNRAAIDRALQDSPAPHIHWVYYDLPAWARFWKRGQRGVHLYYELWQRGAYRVARRLHREVGFDLAHHVTFVNYWMPSHLARLPVPFIWGPLGGGDSAPLAFWRGWSWRAKAYELARSIARWLGEHRPATRRAARRADLVLATTPATAARLRRLGARFVHQFSQVGLGWGELSRLVALPIRESGPFRAVSIGNLLHLKGFDLSLRAFARFLPSRPGSEYWLVGDGPELIRLQDLARSLGVTDHVRFLGSRPREEVFRLLGDMDVLLHPALHDSGGWGCVEAMAAGRPVLCLNLAGPAQIVTSVSGVKVSATSPDQAVADMAHALSRLAMDEGLRRRLAAGGRQTACEQFAWVQKRQRALAFYAKVLGAARMQERSTDGEAGAPAFHAIASQVAEEPGAVGDRP
jgi:glycosyltransferase involved in cell wall biosynthesis